MGKQGLELKGAPIPTSALPCHRLGQLLPCMGAGGRGWRGKRRKPVSDKDTPSIVAGEMVKPAAGEGKSPEVTGTFEVGEDQEKYVVGQICKSMDHSSLSVALDFESGQEGVFWIDGAVILWCIEFLWTTEEGVDKPVATAFIRHSEVKAAAPGDPQFALLGLACLSFIPFDSPNDSKLCDNS